MQRDNVELLDTLTSAEETAGPHRISRLLSASEERVRAILLDPELRYGWAMTGIHTATVPQVISRNGDLLLKEYVRGHEIDVRVRLLERTRVCEVRVELRIRPSSGLATIFTLGIDDLWEARLYAIADLLDPVHPA